MGPLTLVGRFLTTLFLVCMVFTGSGCVGLPMACSDLQAEVDRLHSLQFGSLQRAELRNWAVQAYGIADSAISSSWTADGGMNLSWTVPGWATYVARFGLDGEGPLERVDVYWSQANLTGARAVECLGSPGAYEAFYQTKSPYSLVIRLWYPDRNLAVQSLGATSIGSDGTVLVDGSLVMTGIVAGLPAPASPVTSTQALMRAWPGTWPGSQSVDRGP